MKSDLAVLESIYAELNSAYQNLKAEVLLAEILDNSNITTDDFVIANKSTFSRSYRRDIIKIDDLINKDKLTFNLSRSGIYDMLPEGLFHVPKTNSDSATYLAQRKVIKTEEDDARTFFSPLENEFFYQRLRIERNERKLLDDFYNLNDDFLVDFWNIDDELPEEYVIKLIKLLPHSHKISGDFELTRKCLEKILDEKVTFERKFENTMNTISKEEKNFRNSDLQLGVDSVLNGKSNAVYSPVLKVIIGPVSEKNINKYLKKGGVIKFINTFYNYFIPMEVEVRTNFTINNKSKFLLDETNSPLMGISTQL